MTIAATDRKFFVKVFDDWVTELKTSISNLYSYYGSITELTNYLISLANVQQNRYPFIALVDDFQETIQMKSEWYEVSPTIYVFNETLIELEPSQQYNEIIEPILSPIEDELINVIEFSDNTSQANETVTYSKKTYKGSLNGQTIAETVNCIELKFQNLRIKKNC